LAEGWHPIWGGYIQSGYESDDLIARYVFDNASEDIYIVTADDDMLQLLHKAKIFNMAKSRIYQNQDFQNDYGIKPTDWAYVKMIAGCKSDNVPGIDGVGEKTAIKYIKGDLKKSTKAYQKIKEGSETINFNHQLVSLPFKGTKSMEIEENEFNMREFLRFCRDYGLNSFRKDDRKEEIREHFK